MILDLSKDEAPALSRLLRKSIDDDRYPLSPRIWLLHDILDKIEPPPAHGNTAADKGLRAATSKAETAPRPPMTLFD